MLKSWADLAKIRINLLQADISTEIRNTQRNLEQKASCWLGTEFSFSVTRVFQFRYWKFCGLNITFRLPAKAE
jgi:hypothetical protein